MCVGATGKGAASVGGGAGGGASATSGGVAVVSGAIVVMGLESAGCGTGTAATGGDAFTVFSHPVIASDNPQARSAIRPAAFVLRLGIYLFSSAKGWLKSRSFPAEASIE